MKIKTTLIFFFASFFVQAQTNIFPANGNVGIGTSNPQQKFAVSNNGAEGLEIYLNQPSLVVGLQSYNRQTQAYTKMQFDASQFEFTQGNVGIGTTSPSQKLDVNGIVKWGDLENNYLYSGQEAGGVYFEQVGTSALKSKIRFQSSKNGDQGNYSQFYIDPEKGFYFVSNGSALSNVGIGTTTPDEKLTVKGKIHAEEVRVDLTVPGPDYVFEKDYPLPSLIETQKYIQENKHLPEVPSAKEMETKGINLSEMNMLLLKKVEELTLHLIEQDKMNKKQDAQIEELIKLNKLLMKTNKN
ncbi:hypothetical protein [Pedobacter alpinus]|uniref:Uncharacterized protein n=1 Tax=Pedobacter alpinus TaxID=1590643 RepID=A0ABW5TN88_9SPHI